MITSNKRRSKTMQIFFFCSSISAVQWKADSFSDCSRILSYPCTVPPLETYPGISRPLPAYCLSDAYKMNRYPYHIHLYTFQALVSSFGSLLLSLSVLQSVCPSHIHCNNFQIYSYFSSYLSKFVTLPASHTTFPHAAKRWFLLKTNGNPRLSVL